MSESASSLLLRLRSVLRTRGFGGFVAFLLRRVARRQSDLVYERELIGGESIALTAVGCRVVVVDRSNVDQPDLDGLLAQVLRGEGAVYRRELKGHAVLFAVVDDSGRALHYSFVQYEGRYKRILGEDARVPLFTNCFTDPVARGRGLYPQTLRLACSWLAERGATRAVITCDPSNTASIHGIERAGFVRRRRVESLIVLSRLVVQRVHPVNADARVRVGRL